jgi:hypothetical protein
MQHLNIANTIIPQVDLICRAGANIFLSKGMPVIFNACLLQVALTSPVL